LVVVSGGLWWWLMVVHALLQRSPPPPPPHTHTHTTAAEKGTHSRRRRSSNNSNIDINLFMLEQHTNSTLCWGSLTRASVPSSTYQRKESRHNVNAPHRQRDEFVARARSMTDARAQPLHILQRPRRHCTPAHRLRQRTPTFIGAFQLPLK
jgi:hypothetical protein